MKFEWPFEIVFIDYDPSCGSFERSVFVTKCDLNATLDAFAIDGTEVIDIVPPSPQSIKEILIEHEYTNNLLKESFKTLQRNYLEAFNYV
tara:strand:- start:331 stop:600 length:270 start_codon:yes stop_codon:yes gene_type:complete